MNGNQILIVFVLFRLYIVKYETNKSYIVRVKSKNENFKNLLVFTIYVIEQEWLAEYQLK